MDKEILEKFKQLGPYKNTVVRNPWETNVIDVEEIHRTSYRKAIRSIDNVKKNRNVAIFVLQGEPGSGKSHLLWRISKNAEEKRFLFVNIVPYISVSGISYTIILQSLIESLLKKHPNLKSRPIDHLIGWTIKQGLKLVEQKKIPRQSMFYVETILKQNGLPFVAKGIFETIPQKNTREKLKQEIKNTLTNKYKEFPRYFFHLVAMLMDKEKERLAIDFLKGEELSNEELKELNLSAGFRINEDVAYKLLISFLNFSPFPFVISIDQIETIDRHLSKEDIKDFFEKIVRLFSNSGNALFLLSVQTQTFKKWEKFLPVNVAERLSERATIFPLNINDAKEIIKRRNAFYFKELGIKMENKFYPFKESDISKLFESGNKNPRKLIKAADNLLETGTLDIKKETIDSMLPNYIKQVNIESFNREITDLLIKTAEDYKILKKTSTYTIIKKGKALITVNRTKRSLYSSIKNLSKMLNNGIAKEAIFIGDSKKMISKTAKKTRALIKEYGIKVIYLKPDEAETLIAISKMLRDAESQDIDIKVNMVKKYAEKPLKEILSIVFEKPVLKKFSKTKSITKKPVQNVPFESPLEKVEKIISQYKVITYSNLLHISETQNNDLDNILKKLIDKGKIRTMARGQVEMWIFNNEI